MLLIFIITAIAFPPVGIPLLILYALGYLTFEVITSRIMAIGFALITLILIAFFVAIEFYFTLWVLIPALVICAIGVIKNKKSKK